MTDPGQFEHFDVLLNASVSSVTLSPLTAYPLDINDTLSVYDSNDSFSHTPIDSGDQRFQQVVNKLIIFGIPAIIVIGFFGNTLSFMVFVCTHLRYQSCSVYLAFLNLVDIGFLLSLGVIWFEWLRMNLFHRQVMCQFIIYLSYVCAFLSSWTVVTFTIERYIVVFYPLKKHVLCTPRRAKFIVLGITLCALALYSFSTWMNGVVVHGGRKMCIPLMRYYKVLQGVTAVDTLITFLVPSLLIIVLNIGIVIKICDFIYRRGESGSFVTEESVQLDRTIRIAQCNCSKSAACRLAVGIGTNGNGHKGCVKGKGSGGDRGSGGNGGSCGHGKGNGNVAGKGPCGNGRGSCGNGKGSCGNGKGSCCCCSGKGSCGNGSGSGSGSNGGNNHAANGGAGVGSGGGQGKPHSHGSRCSSSTKRQMNYVFTSALPKKHSKLPCVRHNYQIRTTRALVIVSSTYVLLNLPSHAFRAIACIIYLTDASYRFPKNALIWQNVLQLLYYLNFASNVFLYSASSRSFRSALRRLLARWRHKMHSAIAKVRSRRLCLSFPAKSSKLRGVRL